MGVRTDIQARLIALFKVQEYEIVSYNAAGVPSTDETKEMPGVQCNEISATMDAPAGSAGTLVLTGWVFDVILDFKNEIDYSDFILSLGNMSYAYDDDILVQITFGSTILISHPPTQGGHNGTQLRFNINVDIKN